MKVIYTNDDEQLKAAFQYCIDHEAIFIALDAHINEYKGKCAKWFDTPCDFVTYDDAHFFLDKSRKVVFGDLDEVLATTFANDCVIIGATLHEEG